MPRIIALILSILMLFSSSLTLLSCSEEPPVTDGDEAGEPEAPDTEENPPKVEENEQIKVPEYKDHERGTISFSEIVYTRPDTEGIIEKTYLFKMIYFPVCGYIF